MNKNPYDLNYYENLDDKKDHLLSQENFERLKHVQKIVEQATEVRPTLRKLINGLVNDDALTILIEGLIQQMA